MGASESVFDPVAFREAVTAGLLHGGRLPVAPLIEIVVQYATAFLGEVTTVCRGAPGDMLNDPLGCCLHTDTATGVKSLVFADSTSQRIRRLVSSDGKGFACTDRVVWMAGHNLTGFSETTVPANQARFFYPTSIAVDPLNSNRFYLSDRVSVRVLDETTKRGEFGTVSPIAGCYQSGWKDGAKTDARFTSIAGLALARDAQTLLVADFDKIRSVTIATGDVRTLKVGEKELRFANAIAFAWKPPADTEPDSVCFIVCSKQIVQFNRFTGDVRYIESPAFSRRGELFGIAVLRTGNLLVSCRLSHSVYVVNTTNAACERLAGVGRFGELESEGNSDGPALAGARFYVPSAMAIDETERCVWISDRANHRIRKLTLSNEHFPLL